MCEVSSGTDNNINCSVNNHAGDRTGKIANYSVNNQGGSGTSGNTNNSGNTQGIGGTSNQNNTNRSIETIRRENDFLDEFERAQALFQHQRREVYRMEATVENNRSLEAAFQEQLNEPNLPQEEISRLQQQRQRMARLVVTSTEQLNSMRRDFTTSRRTIERLYPQYYQIMMQD